MRLIGHVVAQVPAVEIVLPVQRTHSVPLALGLPIHFVSDDFRMNGESYPNPASHAVQRLEECYQRCLSPVLTTYPDTPADLTPHGTHAERAELG